MGKKDLDKLFQEKFTDFHELPDEKVWERLEASLDEKKKKDRKVIPIWWKLGGVAAVLALFFYAINPFGSNTNVIEVTDTENTRSIPVDETKTKTSDELLDKNNSEELTDTESTNDSHQEVPKTNSQKSNINSEKRKVQKQNYIPREVVAKIEGDTEKASEKTQENKKGLPNSITNNVIVKNDVSKNANQIDLEKEKRTVVDNKNINSKKFAKLAIEFERDRQIQLISQGQTITQETRLFNAQEGMTYSMRKKEDALDYRYFPEPDLQAIIIQDQLVENIKSSIDFLPWEAENQLIDTYRLAEPIAIQLASKKSFVYTYLDLEKSCEDKTLVANFIVNQLAPVYHTIQADDLKAVLKNCKLLISFIHTKKLTASLAYQKVFPEIIKKPTIDLENFIAEKKLLISE